MINYQFPILKTACTKKVCCLNCAFTQPKDRPNLCIDMKCPDFTPCKECGSNTILNPNSMLCEGCAFEKQKKDNKAQDKLTPPRKPEPPPVETFTLEPDIAEDLPALRDITDIGIPGNAPKAYGERERDYYDQTWLKYQGYYRDPSVYAVVHQLIIVEVELNVLTNHLITSRLKDSKEHQRRHSELVKILGELRAMLPEKQADEETEQDKVFSRVYEKYLLEKSGISSGKLVRVFTQEALALAPILHFKIDVKMIMTNLGFTQVAIDEALTKFYDPNQIPSTAERFMEFLGFYLKEKYALPFDEDAVTEEIWQDMEDAVPKEKRIREEIDEGLDESGSVSSTPKPSRGSYFASG